MSSDEADYVKLNRALNKFTEDKILTSRAESKKVILMCLENAVNPVLSKIAELDPRFKTEVPLIPTRSYFEGLRVSSSNDFNLLVPLTHLLSFKSFDDVGERERQFACYGYVVAKHSSYDISDLVEKAPKRCHAEGYTGNGVLSAEKIRHKFKSLAETALEELPTSSDFKTLFVRQEDAATVIQIQTGKQTYNMDLTPCLSFQRDWPPSAALWGQNCNHWLTPEEVKDVEGFGYFAIPKRCPVDSSDGDLWRLSFTRGEKYLLRNSDIDSPSGRRKQCERILKTIRQANKSAFKPVTSYHIKTLLLHECMKFPQSSQWSKDKLSERFSGLLRSLIFACERRQCPHFFVNNCNLFARYDMADLNEVAAAIKDIYTDIKNMPETTKYLK